MISLPSLETLMISLCFMAAGFSTGFSISWRIWQKRFDKVIDEIMKD